MKWKIKNILKRLGPGFITGTSDNDPAGIGTYIQSGAKFGYAQLWTAFISLPLMIAIQEMCGRIGEVTGQGLAAVIRHHYSRQFLWFIVVIQVFTNTVNIGADLSVMAESLQLLCHASYSLLLGLMTFFIVLLITLLPYRKYSFYLKLLGLSLFIYVIAAFTIKVNWTNAIYSTFIPTILLKKDYLLMMIAVFGATISPYEFFWQANEEVEELITQRKLKNEESSKPLISNYQIKFLRRDTIFGMFFAILIFYFIIINAAAMLHSHGYTNVQTAAEAAEILKPIAGNLSFFIFTAGIVIAGLLAIPVMAASSAYAIAGAFKWPRSLNKPFKKEKKFYGIIILSCMVGVLINFTRIPPLKLLYYSAILNGIISIPLIFTVTQIANNKKIMGKYRNSLASNIAGWILCGFMTVSLIIFIILASYP